MTTTTPLPAPPAWATSSESDSTSRSRFPWATHLSNPVKLISTGGGSQLIAEARLFRFDETGEPSQIFLRLVGAEDGDEEVDLTAEEADAFLVAAELWLGRLRGLRAQMGGV